MIPKKIHYCWFGGNPLPEEAIKCIESWKKYCPDYEIIEWNETNFDVNSNRYTKEAFENRKWAFITDYVRLYVICTYGGIYMDTDVEVVKNLDEFLSLDSFSGFESIDRIPTGIMASKKDGEFIKELLSDYDNRSFVSKDGELDLTTNVDTITQHALKYNLILNNKKQTVKDFTLFPSEWFCPLDYQTLKLTITENTHTIHHFAGSWIENSTSMKLRLKKLLGPRICGLIVKVFKHK